MTMYDSYMRMLSRNQGIPMYCSIILERPTALSGLVEIFRVLALRSLKPHGGLILAPVTSWVLCFLSHQFALFTEGDKQLTQLCIPHMVANKFGRVVFCSRCANAPYFSVNPEGEIYTNSCELVLPQVCRLSVQCVLSRIEAQPGYLPSRYWRSYRSSLFVSQICAAWASSLDFYEIRERGSGKGSLLLLALYGSLIVSMTFYLSGRLATLSPLH